MYGIATQPGAHGSVDQLRRHSLLHELAINPIVYLEISVSFESPSSLDCKLEELQVTMLSIPRRAAFLAGKAYRQYRRRGGIKSNVLSDFFIGAHARCSDAPYSRATGVIMRLTSRPCASSPLSVLC